MSAPGVGEEGDRDRSALGPCSCSSRPKGANGDGGRWGRMGGGRPRELHLLDPLSPSAPPKPLLKPGAFPDPPSASSSSSG